MTYCRWCKDTIWRACTSQHETGRRWWLVSADTKTITELSKLHVVMYLIYFHLTQRLPQCCDNWRGTQTHHPTIKNLLSSSIFPFMYYGAFVFTATCWSNSQLKKTDGPSVWDVIHFILSILKQYLKLRGCCFQSTVTVCSASRALLVAV